MVFRVLEKIANNLIMKLYIIEFQKNYGMYISLEVRHLFLPFLLQSTLNYPVFVETFITCFHCFYTYRNNIHLKSVRTFTLPMYSYMQLCLFCSKAMLSLLFTLSFLHLEKRMQFRIIVHKCLYTTTAEVVFLYLVCIYSNFENMILF